MASTSNDRAKANTRHSAPDIASSKVYISLGPTLSTSEPTMTRAGMVSATLRMSSAETCCLLSPNVSRIEANSGA